MTGSTSASCSTSDSTGTGASSANATWGVPGGTLHIVENPGGDTKTAASASYSGALIVNGIGGGSGLLQLAMTGFSMNSPGMGLPIALVPIALQIGSNTFVQDIPGGPPPSGMVTITAPVTFGVPISFSATISANGTGEMFHDGTYSAGTVEALADFPTFTVMDDSGATIPNATVSVVPEPPSRSLLLCGLLFGLPGCWMVRRERRTY